MNAWHNNLHTVGKMQHMGPEEALTPDPHFDQMGFLVLRRGCARSLIERQFQHLVQSGDDAARVFDKTGAEERGVEELAGD